MCYILGSGSLLKTVLVIQWLNYSYLELNQFQILANKLKKKHSVNKVYLALFF